MDWLPFNAFGTCPSAVRDFADVRNDHTVSKMTDEIQTLGVVDRLFPAILSGEKTSTIRWNERHIVQGALRFICDENRCQTVLVDVFRCTDMPLSAAASFVGMADQWPDHVMLAGMRAHYPEIQLSSIVQVIEYTPPSPN